MERISTRIVTQTKTTQVNESDLCILYFYLETVLCIPHIYQHRALAGLAAIDIRHMYTIHDLRMRNERDWLDMSSCVLRHAFIPPYYINILTSFN